MLVVGYLSWAFKQDLVANDRLLDELEFHL